MPPRPAPDFSAVALRHLGQRCDAFRQHVREHLERPVADAPLAELVDDLRRFRNTLVLLERTGAVFVAEELLALLEARASGALGDPEEFARVLVSAGERLGDHVARLERGGGESDGVAGGEGALALLPLVNDSRACRGAPLLSEALLLAAGIDLPAPAAAAPGDESARAAFVTQVRARQPALRANLSASLRTDPPTASTAGDSAGGPSGIALAAAGDAFEALAALCIAPGLAHLGPALEAAVALVAGIADGEIVDGAAPRRLLGQLTRRLETIEAGDELALPDELQRDLLYYVALIEPSTLRVAALHRRFALGRVRPALEAAARDDAGTTLGTRLSGAIRDSLDVETAGLRQWLEQAPTAADHPHVVRLRERLVHLEPVLTLLGAREARMWLRRINETLETLSGDGPVGATERLMLAESLIRLDRALDVSTAAATAASDGTRDVGTDAAVRLALEDAVTSCLQEARRRLLLVGESLDAPRLVGATPGDAQLVLVERALTVLALPAVAPLLRGLRAVNARLDVTASPAERETLATLLASLEFYLGCVVQPGTGSRRLLHDAEEALARLQGGLPPIAGQSDGSPSDGGSSGNGSPGGGSGPTAATYPDRTPSGETPAERSRVEELVDSAADGSAEVSGADDTGDAADESVARAGAEGREPTGEALARMDAIGEALAGERDGAAVVGPLRAAFEALADIGARGGIQGMRELATAAVRLLERVAFTRGGDDAAVPLDELALLEEAHAVLPQLIEQVHGTSEGVRGLDTLIQDLRGAAPAAPGDGVPTGKAVADGASGEPPLERADAVTPSAEPPPVDDTFDDGDPFDGPDALTLDDTLQQVFRRECATHIDTLARAVAGARQTDGAAERLPSDAMLRALHTLSGSAQTVDAQHIVAVVQPLQRVALARHRRDAPFDAAEVAYVGELVDVLRARLEVLESGAPVAASVAAIESRLPAFVAAGSVERDDGDALDSRSLDSVFDEEARELLARLQEAISSERDSDGAADRALGHLHTLKGSARMVGRHRLAERAHALEGLVQGMPSGAARHRALAAGRRELQSLLLDTAPLERVPITASPASRAAATDGSSTADAARDAASVPAATFENLLTLATDVTVSQARLSDDIARVREICRDLESAAGRWRRLPHEAPLLESPAAREMLADLETARRGLSDALRLADVEQQHASRAASSLQQTLIRTRLVRVDSLRERLAEAVEDAADATGRDARLVVEGGDVTLDGALCRQLRAPLEHLVRNAVVHGIETLRVRREAGKAACGTVRLGAAVDGTEIVLTVEDDGGGIDREAVSRRREAYGHDPVDTVDALQQVLCEAGFTTLDTASVVGGRGLGLAAVSETLARLDGRLHIGTHAGLGTTVTCRLRQRIIVNQVVLVRCARRLYALPVNVVRRVGAAEGTADARAARATPPPRHSLLALLGGVALPAGRDEGETDDTGAYVDGSAELSVEVGGRDFVLEVDRVLGYRELLTQPLGPQLAALRRYAGGSVLPDGRQVLVVELDRLVGEGGPGPGAATALSRPDPETMRPVALVVDDSITLRVAAAGMLGRHGVESREARDGIEALDSLARALPDLMIVDLDMPRLGGFDLIRRMRERHGERAPPVVVVTSRDDEEDRAHAVALGVVRYLTKPYTERELHDALLASGLRLPDLTIA